MAAAKSITTPTASRMPNSRIIGTCEASSARTAMTAATVATPSAGPMWMSVSAKASSGSSWRTSSSTRLWTWMANSTPRPMRIGSPAMVTSESWKPL